MKWPRLVLIIGLALLAGCSMPDRVILDQLTDVGEGKFVAYKMEPGVYKVEVTASQDGVVVRWEGCSCPGSGKETKSFATICELKQTGQLVIENPTAFGLGAGSTVTVKVTRTHS